MKIILNILTHGNEKVGLRVAGEISKMHIRASILMIQPANQKASEANKRFIDQDLNRSFPGRKDGNHEERLAHRILSTIRSADIVLDIHSTTTELKDAIIVTKLNKKTLELVKVIGPKYLIHMNFNKGSSLISNAKIGIAFEYGKEKDNKTLKNIVVGIKRLLAHLGIIKTKPKTSSSPIHLFEVAERVMKPKGYTALSSIKNYKLIHKGQKFAVNSKGEYLCAEEDFYPILFGKNSYKDYFGFKATKYKVL